MDFIMFKDLLFGSAAADFAPHGTCLLWRSELLFLHTLSDGLIAAAYYSIPAALIYFVMRRPDLRFRWMFVLFGLFILACGTTHLMGIWTLWYPDYVLEGWVKLFTAAVSVSTAILMWPLIPHALALPSPAALEAANGLLREEVEERKRAERRIREFSGQLERLVEERTAQLTETNRRLEAEIRVREQAERSLRKSELRLEYILDTNPAAVYILKPTDRPDLPFTVSFVGRSIASITGYEPQVWYDNPGFWIGQMHPEDRARLLEEQAALLAANEWTHQYRFRHRDGSYRWIHDKLYLIRNESGAIVEIIGAWIDITERQQAELELEQAKDAAEAANRAKTLFLANISHELRTPLNGILGFTQLLEREPDLDPKHRDYLDTIRRSGTHLLTLIDDLLDLSKIESGRLDITETVFELNPLLDGIAEMFGLRAEQKGLSFRFDKAGCLPDSVIGDERRLRQVLINLLSNAVKFTQTGGVVLRVACRNGEARIEVEDTGPGIARQDLERIFSPFERLEYHASGEGTGLGLAITKRLVELMEGRLEVLSQWGKGSLFRVTLPLVAVAGPAAGWEKREVVGYEGAPRRVLVVDDNPDNLAILAAALESVDLVAECAASGRECLEKFERFDPELILIDLVMPDLDGTETVRRLRATERGRAVRVIAVTANAFEETRRHCLASGFDDFITKPVELDDLFAHVGANLGLVWRYAGQGRATAALSG
jgi:PAS domain S-box-containing protein